MRSWILALSFILSTTCSVFANENPGFQKPTYFGPLSAAERRFAVSVQHEMQKKYPTAADAEKAGFVRYTSADDTGAISYANQKWQSRDTKTPSQLWYDKNGSLLGADYSRLKTSKKPPKLWGINPGRWWEFDRHMHYVTKDPTTGKITYDGYVADDDFIAAGGSLTNPQPETLVKMAKVKNASDVVTIFNFPAIWDLIVWAIPNPKGPFAYKNPNVKP